MYEVDEMQTYIGRKANKCWIIYAIDRKTKEVIDFCIGSRAQKNIGQIIKPLLAYDPKRIYTDGLNAYPGLIPKELHRIGKYFTNRIERMNLTLRTHLKRLGRKTICYSKSEVMLESCLRIYFWAE